VIALHAIYKFKIRQTVADISRISQFHVLLFNLSTPVIALHAIYKFKIRQTVADISRISQFHVLFNLHTVHTYFLAEVLPFGPTVRPSLSLARLQCSRRRFQRPRDLYKFFWFLSHGLGGFTNRIHRFFSSNQSLKLHKKLGFSSMIKLESK
jgi:hypothetical protein